MATPSDYMMLQDDEGHSSFPKEMYPLYRWFWGQTLGPTDKFPLPSISVLPLIIAICVLTTYLLRPFLRHQPKWTRPFVQELNDIPEVLESDAKKHPEHSILILLIACLAGLTLQLVMAMYPVFHMEALYSAASWIIACFIAAIDRPKTAPVGLLTIIIAELAIHITLLVHARSVFGIRDILATLEILTALTAMTIIFRMPLRNPELPNKEISRPFKPPTHELRTPEDNMTLWQFLTISWMSPLIALASARQLNDEDVWSLGFEFQHRKLHDNFRDLHGSVVKRLFKANGIDCVITTSLGILELVANYSAPVLLQGLLRSMKGSDALKTNAIVYAVLRLVVRLIGAQSYALGLWFSRRGYERSRGEMITMLYEKTLSRKIIGVHAQPAEKPDEDVDGSLSEPAKPKAYPKILWKRLSAYMSGSSRPKIIPLKQPASMGKILNLMRNDVYEVAQRFWEFPSLITKPLGLILSIVLIWRLIGWPCLIGVLTVIVAQLINALITRMMLRWERKRRSATDSRLQKTNQFVEAIRHLRWYGWQNYWRNQIMESRQQELRYLMVARIWGIMISFTNTYASGMFPVVAFYAYTALAGQPLRIEIAFPALQLFTMLENNLRDIPGLITVLLNAYIAVGRIEDFMSEPDKIGKKDKMPQASEEAQFILQDATFAWPGTSRSVLRNINLSFPIGLTVICGKVAAGKTALLQALLGELDTLSGEVVRPDEMVGYCAQSPWLQSMSIRENILFSCPYEEVRYKQVLNDCALSQDLGSFKHGDLSNIGENGIGLSGGQRARVALARAVYSQARTLLLDDPLSALDHHTAETIVRKCFGGSLLKNRTVVLVTHRTELCHGLSRQTVAVFEGQARILDPDASILKDLGKTQSHESIESTSQEGNGEQDKFDVPDKFMDDEHRKHGGVKASVYWEYIKAGKLKWWAVLLCILTVYRVIGVAETWFLKEWSEAYDRSPTESSSGFFDRLPSPEINITPWLLGFFLLATAQAIMLIISQGFMQIIIFSAASQMFRDIIGRVSHATFRFYDVTPIGRLMNRLTSDIGTVDGNISQQFNDVAWLSISWASSLVVIASITPVFLIFSLALTAAFVFIFLQYLPTSQSLRRLEMVSLSPLMSNFGALLEGLTTVRAFCAQNRFQDRVITVVDTFQKMDHFYWSLQAWITYRFDILSASSTLVLTLLAIYTNVSPGLTAFALTASSGFVFATHALCRKYGDLQMDFVSVERVVELLHLEQEPPGDVDPPAWWPSAAGDIVFENVTIRYASHLDPVLQNVSLRIPGGSTTAILGRTGSGKSTLALSILATVVPESGQILIDNIATTAVNVQALRNRITFLPQDPILFPGTMRQNLDPLKEHSNIDCEAVLARVCGDYEWTLSTQIDTGGKNLSQGQRQLVGLARAVLRRSAIIILDEATASIDHSTSLRIQQVLREELSSSTVITIAHRLEAVKDGNFRVVLKEGKVVESGPASNTEQ